MLPAIQLILKKDLGYHFTEEEQKQLELLSEEDLKNLRNRVLGYIKDKNLPLDILEEELDRLKEIEYRFYLSENENREIEEKMEVEEQLEKKCHRMIINLAVGNSNSSDLLGPDIRETYGIHGKRS